MAQRELVSATVVRAVAAREGVDPIDLTPRLYEVIDPDALESLARPLGRREREASVRVEFTHGDWTVVVDGPEDVRVR